MSLKSKILDYLEGCYPSWVHKGTLGRVAVLEWGVEADTLGRRCRDLVTEGRIEKDPDSTEAIYRYVPIKTETKTYQTTLFKVGGYRG